MPLLPVGFFMPLPLPIMIPFMMWQSAAIAAGFGTYFQFAKRRVSAMSNEEFNKADPHELVNSMYEDIVRSIPDSFAKVDSLTPVILQSMNVMLDQAVKWLQNVITGNFTGQPSQPLDDVLPDTDITPALDLLSLTIQFIATMNDLSLAATIRNINDYDANTQKLLLAEQARRVRTEEPVIESPTESQQITKLNPAFIASLTFKDLVKGGSRVRNYKGKLQKWKGTHQIEYKNSKKSWQMFQWVSNLWKSIIIKGNVHTLSQSDALVNEQKRVTKTSYVLVFTKSGTEVYFFIQDDF